MSEVNVTQHTKGVRAQRTDQLAGPGAFTYSSNFLEGIIESGHLVLSAARAERAERERTLGENYLTTYGPAAIALAVTALEIYVNDVLRTCMFISKHNKELYTDLAKRDALPEKYATIPKLMTGQELSNSNVTLLQHIRNEVVHHYPRAVGDTNVPDWLTPLVNLGLFHSIGQAPYDIGWQQKLESYKLAEWCCTNTVDAVRQFINALSGKHIEDMSYALANAKILASLFPILITERTG
jgi:hypothetical protein